MLNKFKIYEATSIIFNTVTKVLTLKEGKYIGYLTTIKDVNGKTSKFNPIDQKFYICPETEYPDMKELVICSFTEEELRCTRKRKCSEKDKRYYNLYEYKCNLNTDVTE
jgi:hypothetical protein